LRLTDVVDYKIAEHLEEPDTTKDMNSAEVYLVAAHRNPVLPFLPGPRRSASGQRGQTMLLRMAQEEMKHKEKVEYLYSNTAFPQTAGG
jgi:hypothetical protein